jgi:hypothetical protein
MSAVFLFFMFYREQDVDVEIVVETTHIQDSFKSLLLLCPHAPNNKIVVYNSSESRMMLYLTHTGDNNPDIQQKYPFFFSSKKVRSILAVLVVVVVVVAALCVSPVTSTTTTNACRISKTVAMKHYYLMLFYKIIIIYASTIK